MNETIYGLKEFVHDTRKALSNKSELEAAHEIKQHLEAFLQHPSMVETYVTGEPNVALGGNVIYKDPDFGFMVLVHFFPKVMKSPPHDHGPCWVLYGVYKEATEMWTYRRVDDGSQRDHAELQADENFTLQSGMARTFLPYDIHQIEHKKPGSVVVRVTGRDLEVVERHNFSLETQQANTTYPKDAGWESMEQPNVA